MKWTRLPDNRVRLVWKCPKCVCLARVDPADAQIPYCLNDDCENYEDEMDYSHAEVLK